MTERLYYHDAYIREFDAQVLGCERVAGAERYAVVLDRTAFYATTGGQPNDTGEIGDANVVDVVEREDLSIVHVTDRPLTPGPVRAALDWERRFDHMQQHTGQHLLSAAFVALFQFPTVSFHLGRDISTIDLAVRSLVPRHIEEAERLANRMIFEDRSVSISFGDAEALADAGIRKAVDPAIALRAGREGVLRVIEVEGFDRQPCGGTHVARTGEVGLILLRKFEKQKGDWRVEFVCGYRALRVARGDFATLGEAAQLLSCGLPEVPAMLAKALEERQASFRARQHLLGKLSDYEAREMLATQSVTAAGRTSVQRAPQIVTRIFEDAEPAYLRMLAAKLVGHAGVQVLLATRAGGYVVFAQSAGMAADMNALLRESLQGVGGKGGGTKDFAQGSLPDATLLDSVVAWASERLRA